LAQVGGVFGLYLGVSGLTLCALLVCLIDAVNRWRMSPEEQVTARRASVRKESVSGWRLFWMTRILQLSQNDQLDDDCAKEHIQQLEQQIDALTQNNNDTKEELNEMRRELRNANDTKEDLVKMEENVNEMRRELRNALQKMMDMRKSIATEPADQLDSAVLIN